MPVAVHDSCATEVEPELAPAALVDAGQEDAHWGRYYWRERYFRSDCEYEDYAPAYCVGYIGYGQYGGSYADAEKSLCANWMRIKGDSRLSLEEALPAIRAAWERVMKAATQPTPQWRELYALAERATPRQPWAPAANASRHQVR